MTSFGKEIVNVDKYNPKHSRWKYVAQNLFFTRPATRVMFPRWETIFSVHLRIKREKKCCLSSCVTLKKNVDKFEIKDFQHFQEIIN